MDLTSVSRVLCLGAHSDDIEIGCGATLLRLLGECPNLQICWVVFSAPAERAEEARRSAHAFLAPGADIDVRIGGFRESYFPAEWAAIKDWFANLQQFEPDLVFTHFRDDRHQDHRVVSDLTWNAFRHPEILEYEIPKWDGDLSQPNCYIDVSAEQVDRKIAILTRHFASQQRKHWFSEDVFRALMRIRGVECARTYAEAFHARKLVL